MAGTWRLGTASLALATAWTLAGRVAEAQVAPLPLSVEIHDYAALPPPVVERAKSVTATIYGRIGVSVTWLENSQVGAALPTNPAACPDSPTALIHVRLFRRSLHSRRLPPGDLGFSVSGTTLASVLVERVENVAIRMNQDVGALLGVVVAHEIGHLLLPPDSHAPGVMAAKIDFSRIEQGGPSFDPGQATMIRARIASMCPETRR
jgi:hypothetical protein